jgi:hypothetical protein
MLNTAPGDTTRRTSLSTLEVRGFAKRNVVTSCSECKAVIPECQLHYYRLFPVLSGIVLPNPNFSGRRNEIRVSGQPFQDIYRQMLLFLQRFLQKSNGSR